MQPHVLLESNGGSARPLSVLEHVLSLLHKLIIDCFPSVLRFQSEESSRSIPCSTKWGNGCGNIMAPYSNLDHVKNRTIIHLEKGMVVSHACC